MALEGPRDAAMTETMYYILLSLASPRHGYGIMLHTRQITNGRLLLGAGTIYNSLARLLRDGLVEICEQTRRRKFYKLTAVGRSVLIREIERLNELCRNGADFARQEPSPQAVKVPAE